MYRCDISVASVGVVLLMLALIHVKDFLNATDTT